MKTRNASKIRNIPITVVPDSHYASTLLWHLKKWIPTIEPSLSYWDCFLSRKRKLVPEIHAIVTRHCYGGGGTLNVLGSREAGKPSNPCPRVPRWRVRVNGIVAGRWERVSVVMVPDAPLLIKDGWLADRDAILICAIIMCTQNSAPWQESTPSPRAPLPCRPPLRSPWVSLFAENSGGIEPRNWGVN